MGKKKTMSAERANAKYKAEVDRRKADQALLAGAKQMEKELEDTKAKLTEREHRVIVLRTGIDTLSMRHSNDMTMLKVEHAHQLEELQKKLDAVSLTNEGWIKTTSELEREVEFLKGKLAAAGTINDDVNNRLNARRAECESLDKEVRDLKHKLDVEQINHEETKGKLVALAQKLSRKDQEKAAALLNRQVISGALPSRMR